jgi:hypothetical protein
METERDRAQAGDLEKGTKVAQPCGQSILIPREEHDADEREEGRSDEPEEGKP